MFRALTCPSSGAQIVLSQHLVSSLSVNGCTVCWMRANYKIVLLQGRQFSSAYIHILFYCYIFSIIQVYSYSFGGRAVDMSRHVV